ncbi:MAG: alpha/beta fold hydrolase [Gemmatimonadaceae bacterium]
MAEMIEWVISVGDETTRAVYEPATSDEQHAVFVCAHGAGGNMMDRSTLAAANALRKHGFGVVRFNFLYKEKGSGRPDPMPKLMATFSAVVDRVRAELKPETMAIGGRSMGGRAASMLAAGGFDADGLLLLAYPLHPEGQPAKLRDAHLPQITMPVICFNGTRDGLCTPEWMNRAVATVECPWEMHWIDGADHSFHVLKSSGRNDAAVLVEVGDAAERWLATISRRGESTSKE